jgi:hypothetical protein
VRATSGIDGGGKLIVAGEKWTGSLCLPVLRRVAFAVWLLAESLLTSQHLSVLRFAASLSRLAAGPACSAPWAKPELGKIVLLLDQRCSLN